MTHSKNKCDAYDTVNGKYSCRKIPKWNSRHYFFTELVDEIKEDKQGKLGFSIEL